MDLTPEQLKEYLKPKHSWLSIIGTVLAMLTAGAALAKFAFTAPTQSDYQNHELRIRAQEIDSAVFKSQVGGLRDDVSGMKQDDKEFRQDVNVKLDKLIQHSRRSHD